MDAFENIPGIKTNDSVVIFWFRRDLRIDDNTGLYHALNSGKKVLPIFIFDTEIIEHPDKRTDARIIFIRNALQMIQEKLQSSGSSLLLLTGKPTEIFNGLTEKLNIHEVYTNHDYEPYAIKRDQAVATLLQLKGIGFKTFKDQVIFEKNDIIKANGEPYTVFTPYSRQWIKTINKLTLSLYNPQQLIHNLVRCEIPRSDEMLKNTISIDSLPTKPEIPLDIIRNYHLTRDIPSIEGTSKLSHHLRFGTISIRKLVNMAMELNETFLGELIWREFFMMILWYFPGVVTNSFKTKYASIEWKNNENEFIRWCNGETGYPLVDAGMRELNATGWMHNRVRMITAGFLVKHLLIDWRWGEAYFAQKLLDFELSSNNGNWQWAAGCGCDAAPYFRIFNPYEQAKKFDPHHTYIIKWVPEYGTKNYAQPMVEHNFARQRAINTYKRSLLY